MKQCPGLLGITSTTLAYLKFKTGAQKTKQKCPSNFNLKKF